MSALRKQQPGRLEAMRLLIDSGFANATPELRHLAGFDRVFGPRPAQQAYGVMPKIETGLEKLTQAERTALPF